jgi:hypothetical protein
MFSIPNSQIIQPSAVAIGSNQLAGSWSQWLSSDAALPAVTNKHISLTNWASDPANGLLYIPAGGKCCMSLSFLQAMNSAGDPNGLTSTARLWITHFDTQADHSMAEGSALYACDLLLTCGNIATPAGSWHTDPLIKGVVTPNGYGVKYTKAITESSDCTLAPGIRHVGQDGATANAWDRIVLDLAGGTGVLIATKIDNVDRLRIRSCPF